MPNEKNKKYTTQAGAVLAPVKRFSTEYDTRVMKAWAKQSNKCGGFLADPVVRKKFLEGARALAEMQKGYTNGDKNFEALLPLPHAKKNTKKTLK
jgi:hypothetical protein